MNKHLLFLTTIIGFFFAGNLKSQNLTGMPASPSPQAVACLTGDALHPVAGTKYTYKVNVPAPEGNKEYTWFVTQDKNFITSGALTGNREAANGAHILETGAGYNDAANGTNVLEITWKTFVYNATNPLFVVVQVKNTPLNETCSTQNLKVYKINPQHAFTLDIANLKPDGSLLSYGAKNSGCASNMVSALYDSSAPEGIGYDYGSNYIFYAVTAANYTNSWSPTFELSNLKSTQTAEVSWAYASDASAWTTTAPPVSNGNGIYTSATEVKAKAANAAVGASGECIIVRVKINHHKTELLTQQNIKLAVDGTSNGLPDVHHAAGASCSLPDGYTNDFAEHTLLPLPDIQTNTVGGAFLPAK